MNSKQLLRVLKSDSYTRARLGGVFPADQLPVIHSYPYVLICNTDTKDLPGAHWLAIYFDSNRRAEFFDSYGLPLAFYGHFFEQFLRKNSVGFTHNSKCLQSLMSTVCGQFCIFYLIHRSRGVSLEKIISVFTEDPFINDELVHDFIKERYDVDVPVSDFEFICNQICIKRQHFRK